MFTRTYGLYLESGPKRRKTMVHVPELLGCMANGPTTEAALEATPEAIRAYLRFLDRCGEPVDLEEPFEVEVIEHAMEGMRLGEGSPYVTFGPDYEPVTADEIETFCGRFHRLREELAGWAEAQSPAALDAEPEGGGRTARAILLHILAVPGGYLGAALGGSSGFSRIQRLTERGEMDLAEGLRLVDAMVTERLRETTEAERAAVRHRPKEDRTLRKAIRHTLEHDWEHLAELSRRPGGPPL